MPGAIRNFHGLLLASLVAVFACVLSADARGANLDNLDFRLSQAEELIGKAPRKGSILNQLQAEIDSIVGTATRLRGDAQKKTRQTRTLLAALGEKPADGTAPESLDLQAKRKTLEADLANVEGREKRAGLIITRGEQMLAELGRLSREQLAETLLTPGQTPFSLSVWQEFLAETPPLLNRSFVETTNRWLERIRTTDRPNDGLARMILIIGLCLIGVLTARILLKSRFGWRNTDASVTQSERLKAGVAEATGRSFIPAAAVFVIWVGLAQNADFTAGLAASLDALVEQLIILLIGFGLINAAFSPNYPDWQVVGLARETGKRLARGLTSVLVLFVSFTALHGAVAWLKPAGGFEAAYALIYTGVLTPFLLSLLSRRTWQYSAETDNDPATDEAAPVSVGSSLIHLKPLLALVFTAPLFAALLAYPTLAIYLARAVVLSAMTFGAIWFLRLVFQHLLTEAFEGTSRFSLALREYLTIGTRVARRLTFWLGLLTDLFLMLGAIVALLAIWGFRSEETLAWSAKLFRGIQIGSFTFSMLDVLVAIALFSAIVIVTRLLQRTLERHILPNVTTDHGVRDALKTSAGYVGIVIAAIVGISALGLDLSNLALIAGALTVGLGFGLQNIVNNFVSGLILLAERPIKPGDWVVIGGHEGKVKKVNVRSTEVETFQRASVILPNADLISSPVVNWTHKNVLGRVEVLVGVAYGSDEAKVEGILLSIASAHPNVLVTPPPQVLLMNFGESSIDFELRAFLNNVEMRVQTASDMRKEISKAFRENNIEIPFPQRVVHIHRAQAPNHDPSEG